MMETSHIRETLITIARDVSDQIKLARATQLLIDGPGDLVTRADFDKREVVFGEAVIKLTDRLVEVESQLEATKLILSRVKKMTTIGGFTAISVLSAGEILSKLPALLAAFFG